MPLEPSPSFPDWWSFFSNLQGGVKRRATRADGLPAEAPMTPTVRERIHQILFRYLGVDESELLPEANLQDDLGADSLDVVELVMAFEESFDLQVPDEDVERMRTLGDIERYLEKRVQAVPIV